MRRGLGVLLGIIAVLTPSARAADTAPAVRDLVSRAGEYVQKFEDTFSTVISIERYEQHAEQRREAPPRAWLLVSSEARTLRSEMLLTRLPGQPDWLTVRSVLAVDGAPVPDSADRLERALAEPGAAGVLQALADDSAKFNLGRIRRSLNDPTLALRFLEPTSQAGFTFSLTGREQPNGLDAWRVAFAELRVPSVIRNARNEDLPVTGSIWLAVLDGSVVRTNVVVFDKGARLLSTSVVDYQREPKLDTWVPSRMTESYSERTGSIEERIVCMATYSDFRHFETSGRLITPR
jgi:hypothetical protein